jgi:uncharacterized protein (DUF2252 family)
MCSLFSEPRFSDGCSFTNDLVRLVVSAKLAVSADHLTIKPKDACDAILTGYREGLKAEGRPIVLDEHHRWLLDITTSKFRDPVRFWRTMQTLPLVKGSISASTRAALDHLLPEPKLSYSLRRRVSGIGSLGRPRYVALAEWHGGKIAREAKALVPSARSLGKGWAGTPHDHVSIARRSGGSEP